jgi:hypothetical protein
MEESVRQKLETRVMRLEQQIRAFKELHANELGQILDELASLRADLAAMAAPRSDTPAATGTLRDPAAGSPKRAAWLAELERREQQQKAPLSRRELLRGREDEEKS